MAGESITPEQYHKMLAEAMSERELQPEPRGWDHVVPLAALGRNDIDNIVACCITCNRRKYTRTPEEWRDGVHTKNGMWRIAR